MSEGRGRGLGLQLHVARAHAHWGPLPPHCRRLAAAAAAADCQRHPAPWQRPTLRHRGAGAASKRAGCVRAQGGPACRARSAVMGPCWQTSWVCARAVGAQGGPTSSDGALPRVASITHASGPAPTTHAPPSNVHTRPPPTCTRLAGSSIMPGKVNPTQCEMLTMVCCQVRCGARRGEVTPRWGGAQGVA